MPLDTLRELGLSYDPYLDYDGGEIGEEKESMLDPEKLDKEEVAGIIFSGGMAAPKGDFSG